MSMNHTEKNSQTGEIQQQSGRKTVRRAEYHTKQDEAWFHGDLVTSKRNIYTPSVFARECLLYLQEAGSLRAAKPHTSRRAGLSSYLFFYVVSGSGTLKVGDRDYRKAAAIQNPGEVPYGKDRTPDTSSGKEMRSEKNAPESYHLHAGDCVFLDCRIPYSHSTSGDLWELKWVHFNGEQMQGIYRKYLERSGGPVFHPSSDNTIEWKLDRIYNISVTGSYIRDMQINEALASLLSSVMEYSWNPDTDGKKLQRHPGNFSSASAAPSFRISDVKDYIDGHYMENFSLKELADQFHFNKYYLMRLFREQYGTTIINYRTQVRINTVKKLLRFTDLSLEEAGAEVGIHDANYFSRVFRKVEGVTPGEYRKMW